MGFTTFIDEYQHWLVTETETERRRMVCTK